MYLYQSKTKAIFYFLGGMVIPGLVIFRSDRSTFFIIFAALVFTASFIESGAALLYPKHPIMSIRDGKLYYRKWHSKNYKFISIERIEDAKIRRNHLHSWINIYGNFDTITIGTTFAREDIDVFLSNITCQPLPSEY